MSQNKRIIKGVVGRPTIAAGQVQKVGTSGGASPGGIFPSGTKSITDTALNDVKQYAYAQVQDADLVAANIKDGVEILGVEGTYTGVALETSRTISPSITNQVVVSPSSGYGGLQEVVVERAGSWGGNGNISWDYDVDLRSLNIYVANPSSSCVINYYSGAPGDSPTLTSTATIISGNALGNTVPYGYSNYELQIGSSTELYTYENLSYYIPHTNANVYYY